MAAVSTPPAVYLVCHSFDRHPVPAWAETAGNFKTPIERRGLRFLLTDKEGNPSDVAKELEPKFKSAIMACAGDHVEFQTPAGRPSKPKCTAEADRATRRGALVFKGLGYPRCEVYVRVKPDDPDADELMPTKDVHTLMEEAKRTLWVAEVHGAANFYPTKEKYTAGVNMQLVRVVIMPKDYDPRSKAPLRRSDSTMSVDQAGAAPAAAAVAAPATMEE